MTAEIVPFPKNQSTAPKHDGAEALRVAGCFLEARDFETALKFTALAIDLIRAERNTGEGLPQGAMTSREWFRAFADRAAASLNEGDFHKARHTVLMMLADIRDARRKALRRKRCHAKRANRNG